MVICSRGYCKIDKCRKWRNRTSRETLDFWHPLQLAAQLNILLKRRWLGAKEQHDYTLNSHKKTIEPIRFEMCKVLPQPRPHEYHHCLVLLTSCNPDSSALPILGAKNLKKVLNAPTPNLHN